MKNEIIIFENQNVKLEVNMKDETVWLSLEQMAKLFDRDGTVVMRHINNILKNEELNRLLAKLYLQTKIIKTTYNYCSQIEGWYSRTISFS